MSSETGETWQPGYQEIINYLDPESVQPRNMATSKPGNLATFKPSNLDSLNL